jgi:Leucine-rich repeat (LRR) protein
MSFEVISDLSELEVLALSYTQLTDKSFEYLKNLKKLRILFAENGITDKALNSLNELVIFRI